VSFDKDRAEVIPEHRRQQQSCATCQPPSWIGAGHDAPGPVGARSVPNGDIQKRLPSGRTGWLVNPDERRYRFRVTTFALIGSGWRARMFLEVARELGTIRCGGAVVRTPRRLEVPTFTSLDACLREVAIDFVLTATPRAVTPHLIADAVDRGLPVLAETPPAPDLDSLRALWSAVGDSGLVQVAEQYLMMPSHAARAALVATGAIGTPTQVQVSSTQQYHAVALIRGLLCAGRGSVSVRATRFTAPLISPLSRTGWTDDEEAHPTTTTIATLDFGDGRSGVYDFTEQQTRNQLRFRRLTVRGSAGELHNDEVVRMTGPHSLVRTPLVRRQTGYDLDLIGYDTEHISIGSEVLYRNPYPGRRWMDEEIAMATLLERTASWVRGEGPEPYPLAEGAQDQQLALAIEQAADSDTTVTTSSEAWS
jgi:predicted dehydrogenase